MSARKDFGRRLKQLRRLKSAREERDVPQGEVAAFVGDTQPNVAKWEGGRLPEDENTVRKLAAFYGVNYAWLRLGEGKPEIAPANDAGVTQFHGGPVVAPDTRTRRDA